MTDQGPEITEQVAEGDAPKVEKTEASADVAALQERLNAIEAKNKDLERDNAKYREERRAAKQADEQAKLKAGEFEPLLAERESRIAELEAKVAELEPDAKALRESRKLEEKAIAAEVESLDDGDKAIVLNLPLEQRRAAIARLGGVKTKERAPEHPAAEPSPPAGDIGSMTPGISKSDPSRWQALKRAAGFSGGEPARKPFFAS